MTTVLHVPYAFAPDPIGGTEVYVDSLAAELESFGVTSVVAAPARSEARYRHGETDVFRFAVTGRPGWAEAQGKPDRDAAASFARVLDVVRPRVVHLHAHTSAVSSLLLDEARRAGARTVVTYHSPTFSCLRETLMHMGVEVCDGLIRTRRCAACAIAAHGIPPAAANIAALVPPALGQAIANLGAVGKLRTALAMSATAKSTGTRFRRLMTDADRVIAPAAWIVDVLRLNGIPTARTTLVRQGLAGAYPAAGGDAPGSRDAGPLRVGFFGRLSRPKGIDILVAALALIPDARVVLDLTVISDPLDASGTEDLARAIAADPRIRLRPALPPGAVVAAMRSLDLVAVPSRGLETGPLVVLEAFAAGTPVLGSRLGGIAELVRDGIDGVLVPPDDAPALAAEISRLAADRVPLARLRASIRPPRTMPDVARDMAAIYAELLA